MAFIVEDGTGQSYADSYASVDETRAYAKARGKDAFARLDRAVLETLLRLATDYMSQMYRPRWLGSRATGTQRLDWPRSGVPVTDAPDGTWIATNVVPEPVRNACIELAMRAQGGDLAPDLGPRVKSEQVGDIRVEYDAYSIPFTQYRAVDAMLAPLLQSTPAASLRLVRA